MASIGHLAVGLAAGRFYARGEGLKANLKAMIAFSTISFVPDLDVLGFRYGIAYVDEWGHRGASHSITFALLLAVIGGLMATRSGHRFWRAAPLVALVMASHGALDTLTDGGLGVALLWPFSNERFFALWRPLEVAPIGRAFLTPRGLRIALNEAVWFTPLWLMAFWPWSLRRRRG